MMYIVDSGASLHMMNTSRQSSKILDIQTANGVVGSWALFPVFIWWKIHNRCHRLEDYAMSLVVLIRGRQEKLTDYQKVKK